MIACESKHPRICDVGKPKRNVLVILVGDCRLLVSAVIFKLGGVIYGIAPTSMALLIGRGHH